MQDGPDLSDALTRLSKALAELGLPYVLIGGIAVVLRGYDRSTQDIDAIVLGADDHLTRILETFARHGFVGRIPDVEVFARHNRIILLQAPDRTGLDLSMGVLPFEEEVVQRATWEPIANSLTMPIATAEDLIIMKVIAGRARDLDDARRIAELYPNLDRVRVRRIVEEYAEALDEPHITRNLDVLLDDTDTDDSGA